jgi:hypothetical protein
VTERLSAKSRATTEHERVDAGFLVALPANLAWISRAHEGEAGFCPSGAALGRALVAGQRFAESG